MAQKFPLYESLVAEVKKNPQIFEVDKLCGIMKRLDKDHGFIIDLLIYHYAVLNGNLSFQTIPYSGKTLTGGSGIIYNAKKIPPYLQQILYAYANIYALEA